MTTYFLMFRDPSGPLLTILRPKVFHLWVMAVASCIPTIKQTRRSRDGGVLIGTGGMVGKPARHTSCRIVTLKVMMQMKPNSLVWISPNLPIHITITGLILDVNKLRCRLAGTGPEQISLARSAPAAMISLNLTEKRRRR